MNNRSLVREDHVLRYRLFVDIEAGVFDSFRVELLEQSFLVTGIAVDAAWREALAVVSMMRAEYLRAPIRDPLHFQPFAIITAVEGARESAKLTVRNQMMFGSALPEQAKDFPGPEPEYSPQMQRVAALCKALDAIEFLQRPQSKALN